MIDGNMLLAEFVKIFPNCALILLIVVVVLVFRDPLRRLFAQMTHVDLLGVKMDFAEAAEVKEELRNAINSYSGIEWYRQGQDESATQKATVDEKTLQQLLDHAERIKKYLHGARILWVDDQPLANAAIFRFLNNYNVVIDYARNTKEAESALEWSADAYEVVVSDMIRDDDGRAGLDLLDITQRMNKSKDRDDQIMVLIFVNNLDTSKGTPAGAKLITNQVDDLLEEIFDIIERKQLQYSNTKH